MDPVVQAYVSLSLAGLIKQAESGHPHLSLGHGHVLALPQPGPVLFNGLAAALAGAGVGAAMPGVDEETGERKSRWRSALEMGGLSGMLGMSATGWLDLSRNLGRAESQDVNAYHATGTGA